MKNISPKLQPEPHTHYLLKSETPPPSSLNSFSRGLTILFTLAIITSACAAPRPPRQAAAPEPQQSYTQTTSETTSETTTPKTFVLSSPAVTDGRLPTEYTCDGASATLPLLWSGVPAGTKSLALIMHHVAGPDDIHWYWVLYNLPASLNSLDKNTSGTGTLGTNSVNKNMAYTPPCSKGPGDKLYTLTLYALSAEPQFSVPAGQVNRDVLLQAIQSVTIDSAELQVTYARK